jgi:PAS domain S-box-containing protein
VVARKHAETSLAESERVRRSILESVEEGIHGLDITGHIVFENPASLKMFGWKAQEMVGQHSHTLIHHHRADGSLYPVEECPVYCTLHDGQTRHIHNEVFFRQDGTSFPVEYTASALRDDSGVIAGVVVTFSDVTEIKQLEKQFLQSQKLEAIGELAGGIAHDFNNNLSAILGFSDLALDRLRPDDPLHRYIMQVKKAGEQSASLTRQLLAFSRKQILQPKVLDLNALITDMKTMLHRMIGEGIDLHTLLHPELGRVKADPGQVEQVLMNLAVNARDAMAHGGTLTLATGNVDADEAQARTRIPMIAGSYIGLAVSDTGCGMDAKTQARIFEPFFTTKEMGKGTGLGLSTVYGIVKQSGGYIWIDSAPGQGTTFEIFLPRVEAPLEATPSPEVTMRALRGSETVLLVEDEEIVRAIARDTLQACGYTVLEAMNGGGAILISERHQGTIDLLLTDVVMPYMNGPELAQCLTAQHPEIRVLYMSGYTDEALAPHGILQPDIAFLAKPFTPDLLARKVRETLDVPA